MKKPLFTNVTTIKSNEGEVKSFIADITNALKWDSELATVVKENETYHIVRTGNALNEEEYIVVSTDDKTITYHSSGGRLEYDLEFSIVEKDRFIELSQTLIIGEDVDGHIPVKLLKPIAKHAFSKKLDKLAKIIELENTL
ncbi:SRPBCC family protein [Carnobacterium maltaromaticum]|uniref:SRPBCC family protein n=1 Tax=Carnobacterium maltaromaticum TaxID=2751 RepID=UPI00295F3F2B|nr:SRPBCC family protein [Carnobacterium maltaromaticum]